MTPDQIAQANLELRHQPALEIVKWAVARANGRAIVSTNFRPYEAVLLHLCVQVRPDMPVLWSTTVTIARLLTNTPKSCGSGSS